MRPILLVALLTLAACGADGPPERPADSTASGITITGEARMGISTGL